MLAQLDPIKFSLIGLLIGHQQKAQTHPPPKKKKKEKQGRINEKPKPGKKKKR